MFEFHGWFNLRVSTYEVAPDKEEAFAGRVRERVMALEWPQFVAFAQIQVLNGEYCLVVGGNPNHRGQVGRELDELLAFVAIEAPGSHGLLYWRDVEGEPLAGPNNFQVVVMARGALTSRFDPFLSPTIPTVEDAWEPGRE